MISIILLEKLRKKFFTDKQIDDLLKLKYGKIVTEPGHTAYVSNAILGKIFGCSNTHIRYICNARFEKNRIKKLPLLQ